MFNNDYNLSCWYVAGQCLNREMDIIMVWSSWWFSCCCCCNLPISPILCHPHFQYNSLMFMLVLVLVLYAIHIFYIVVMIMTIQVSMWTVTIPSSTPIYLCNILIIHVIALVACTEWWPIVISQWIPSISSTVWTI